MTAPSEWLEPAPLVIAHRGASSVAPENTIPAFEAAAACGAEAIELDTKLTADGRVVAFHDQTLARTTGAPGCVGDLPWEAVRRLDAGSWMGEKFRGVGIPLLADVLEGFGRRMLLNIELTEYRRPQEPLVRAVVDLVRRQGLERRVLLSSFQASALRAARALAPELPLGHLRGPTWLSVRDLAGGPRPAVEAIHLHHQLMRLPWVVLLRRGRRRLHVYTVDEPRSIARLWQRGVDGLITNVPELARRLRRASDGTGRRD